MTNLTNLTGPELVTLYNELAEQAGKPRVKRFENRAAGIRRVQALMPAERKTPRRRPRKTPVDKVDSRIVSFMKKWEGSKIEMIRQLIETYPDCTRITVRHSAKAAGENFLTARNNYDKIRRERGEKL